MLTDRRSSLLNLIVEEYVDTAVPVGSKYIVGKHRMPVSPATVRLEMARLEDDGYILMRDSKDTSRPHLRFDRTDWQQFVDEITSDRSRSR